MKSNRGPNLGGAISMLKKNYNTLLSFKNNSPSQVQFLLASILGVGVGIASLILSQIDGKGGWFYNLTWAKQNRDTDKNIFVAGLQNLGNNCFLNAVLQALSSCHHFHSFLQDIIDSYDLLDEEKLEDFPLAVALIAIIKELSLHRDERIVVSPRRLMLAMSFYVSSFSLTSQQDAAEALLHLLSSLKEELSQSYLPQHGTLADISILSDCRIINPNMLEDGKEWDRWQKSLLGPFYGTIGSTLTCKTCRVELSMNFELFCSLPISPVLDQRGYIIDGCTVEDCLKQFISTEQIGNYLCNHCWHKAGIKYLSILREANEAKLKKLKNCLNLDSCDCKNLLLDEGVSLPTVYSCALKQLDIGRSPEILCIHLQRSTMSERGELIKLQGPISFPSVLNMLPFMAAIGEGNIMNKDLHVHLTHSWTPFPSHRDKQLEVPPRLFGLVGGDVTLEKEFDKVNDTRIKHADSEDSTGALDSLYTGKLIKTTSLPVKNYMYSLVSVVEHYGKAGSGHYAVYRNVKVESAAEGSDASHWYYVSDGEVSLVSEDVVLAAEASLLFYEKI